ncbi:uncharacterized protein BJ171DRAFT_501072 [Polychytrium aggregatum]|uniref:uncharacterized protein n=1 Tax=Polychytrium aggregatum TaxID=110093 RepID=UPI0022FEEFAC|nr:uncharacterized protein BJ171DRAFT_501072 [Polychytrium aggregatum]KAI9205637.1 hypothetical protein BJ171DRAFT_501072 [Polychytrium aggregatum]
MAPAPPPVPRTSLSIIAAQERELRSMIKDDISIFDKAINQLRLELRGNIESLILREFELALSKDLEATLWKVIHYRVIDEFRKKHRHLSSQKKPSASAARDGRELRQLTAQFRSFLTESEGFYLDLIVKLAARFRLQPVTDKVIVPFRMDFERLDQDPCADDELTPELQHKVLLACHRSLIFLGDLARYREIHAEKKRKNWTSARRFYAIALSLAPGNGNPFNQLAVIDTYDGNAVSAVESYFRSLAIELPFPTARGNLALFFEKEKKKWEVELEHLNGEKKTKVHGRSILKSQVAELVSSSDVLKSSSGAIFSFLVQFFSLHSSIFGNDENLSLFSSTIIQVENGFPEFLRLIRASPAPGDLIFKLFTINMSSLFLHQQKIHQLSGPKAGSSKLSLSNRQPPAAGESSFVATKNFSKGKHMAIEQKVVQLIYKMLQSVIEFIMTDPDGSDDDIGSQWNESRFKMGYMTLYLGLKWVYARQQQHSVANDSSGSQANLVANPTSLSPICDFKNTYGLATGASSRSDWTTNNFWNALEQLFGRLRSVAQERGRDCGFSERCSDSDANETAPVSSRDDSGPQGSSASVSSQAPAVKAVGPPRSPEGLEISGFAPLMLVTPFAGTDAQQHKTGGSHVPTAFSLSALGAPGRERHYDVSVYDEFDIRIFWMVDDIEAVLLAKPRVDFLSRSHHDPMGLARPAYQGARSPTFDAQNEAHGTHSSQDNPPLRIATSSRPKSGLSSPTPDAGSVHLTDDTLDRTFKSRRTSNGSPLASVAKAGFARARATSPIIHHHQQNIWGAPISTGFPNGEPTDLLKFDHKHMRTKSSISSLKTLDHLAEPENACSSRQSPLSPNSMHSLPLECPSDLTKAVDVGGGEFDLSAEKLGSSFGAGADAVGTLSFLGLLNDMEARNAIRYSLRFLHISYIRMCPLCDINYRDLMHTTARSPSRRFRSWISSKPQNLGILADLAIDSGEFNRPFRNASTGFGGMLIPTQAIVTNTAILSGAAQSPSPWTYPFSSNPSETPSSADVFGTNSNAFDKMSPRGMHWMDLLSRPGEGSQLFGASSQS